MITTMLAEMNLSPFQQKCLRAFEKGRNVLIVAPSSAGKTFVTKQFLYRYFQQNFGKFLHSPHSFKVAFVFPYKSLAIQEYFEFQDIVEGTGIKTLLTVGGMDIQTEDIIETNIIIGTYEKFLFLFRRSKELKKSLRILAIDEFHFIGSERGTVIEEIIMEAQKMDVEPKLILLSSTINNSEEIASWLNAQLIIGDSRPIPLRYNIITVRNIQEFLLEQLKNKNQRAIVFCASRGMAERLAIELGKLMNNEDQELSLRDFIRLQHGDDNGIPPEEPYIPSDLIELVKKGIAYHHAGLNEIVRLLIEQLLTIKRLKIIFSTSTLAAGVNLPVERVFFLVPKRISVINNNMIFQMLGRAGRLGLTDKGEGIILTLNRNKYSQIKQKLFLFNNDELEPIYNDVLSFFGEYENLARYLLISMAENGGTINGDFNSLFSIFSDSLWFYQNREILVPNNEIKLLHALFSSIESPLEPDDVIEFYKHYDDALGKKAGRMTITSYVREGSRIRAIVKERSKVFQVYFSLISRRCSCQEANSNLVCRHQRFILTQHPELKVLLTKYGIIDYLVQNGFVVRSRDIKITLTKLGWLTVRYNLLPSELMQFLEFNANSANNTLEQYIHKIATSYSYFVKERKANELNIINTLRMIKDIITNTSTRQICERYKVSDSTVEEWKEHIIKILLLFVELSKYQGRKAFAEKISNSLTKIKNVKK